MKNIILCTLIGFILGGIVLGVWQYRHRADPLVPGGSYTVQPVSISEESKTVDYSDDRVLLGNSHNAFVGKILRKIGDKKLSNTTNPSSQYEVHVLLNIKGNLKGVIVLNQFERDTRPILQIGSSYVFVTRYYKEENVYLVVYYPSDYQLLTDNSTVSDSQLQALAESSERVGVLRLAYPSERLGTDIRDDKAWNSYISRHYDTNGELIDDTVELRKQLEAAAAASATPADTTPTPVPVPVEEPSPTETPTSEPTQS